MIRTFIIDDDVVVRYGLTQLLNQETDIAVVGDTSPSDNLIREVEKAKPDILILDIPIPRDVGIKQLITLHKFHLPVIVFTDSNKTIAQDLIPLLEAGAVGFVIKPQHKTAISDIKEQLLYELRSNSKKNHPQTASKTAHKISFLDPLWCVAIGSSTGGPEALLEVIPKFPANFPAAIALVQHMPAGFTTRFAERLHNNSAIAVKEAVQGDVLKAGMALMAPGDWHMEFVEDYTGNRRFGKVNLTKDPPQWLLRPTVDHMMSSLAPIYGNRIVGVILTGMGEDGVIGMRAIKNNGGHTIVQNKATSVVFGMGQEVIKNNLADEVLPLSKIAERIMEIITL